MMDGQIFKRAPLKAWQRDWKQELRKSCLRRVGQERHQLLWRIRSVGKSSEAPKEAATSAFNEILDDEMNKFKMTAGVQNATSQEGEMVSRLWEHEPSKVFLELAQEDYEELMIAMEKILHEDVEAEQRQKEAALLDDYEKVSVMEDQSLATLLEHLENNEEDGLLCPICRTRLLQQRQQHIHCSCGQFDLNIQNDQVDLQFLRRRLSEVLQQHHNLGCRSQPTFCIDWKFGISALYMQCSLCEMFELVL